MTGGQDHSGDAVRQRLAEIQQRAGASSELVASEGDTARSWAAATASALDVYPMVAALTAVLDRHKPIVFTGWRKLVRVGAKLPAEGAVCITCERYHPCATYSAVAAALEEQP